MKNKDLWNKSKSASEYPKDWYVIPTLEVIEIKNEFIRLLEKEIEESSWFENGEGIKTYHIRIDRLKIIFDELTGFAENKSEDKECNK